MLTLTRICKTLACSAALAATAMIPHAAQATDLADPVIKQQLADFQQNKVRAMRDFQPFRKSTTVQSEEGKEVTLTSLNPRFNSWFLVDVKRSAEDTSADTFHIELSNPEDTILTLSTKGEPALVFDNNGAIFRCEPWKGRLTELDRAKSSGLPYAPICDDYAFVRNVVRGNRSSREAVAEFLRDNVVFGESIVTLIKGSFYEDAYMSSGEVIDGGNAGEIADALGKAKLSSHPVFRAYFGFELEGADGGLEAGRWYAVKDAPGIYASAMQPGMIDRSILSRPGETHGLDGVESRADVYLVAFDMTQFELGYEVGTDHPRLDWSPRPGVARGNLPGPDGFRNSGSIVRTGMLSPALTDRVAATFAAGFKRSHGAWRASDKAFSNQGHHYGFLSNGVVFSRLHPGLSTIYVLDDGTVGMRTWTEADEDLLPSLRFARQNGVPLIEPNAQGEGVPGSQVTSWLGGNWSGSAEADLRTLRGGACLREVDGRQFLIYAYFSTATPSAMARTFQAYQCDYAMLLDMNSQDHTYMALYTENDGTPVPEHLVSGMSAIDQRTSSGAPIPRFVGFSDNRDFMYLLRK